jgi:hypothetical protein
MSTYNDISKIIESKIKKLVNKQLMEFIGERVKDIIRKRTKIGYGITSESKTRSVSKKLKPLSSAYVKYRKKVGVKGEYGSPERSNLTNTGQMLDAIKVTAQQAKVLVEIAETTRDEGNITNKEVAKYVSKDRLFFGLTKQEYQLLVRDVQEYIKRRL